MLRVQLGLHLLLQLLHVGRSTRPRVPRPGLRRCPRPGPHPRAAPAFPPVVPVAAMSKEPRAGREEILECQVMWEPDSKKNTQMDRFRAVVGAAYGLALGECGARVLGAPRPPPGARSFQKSGSPLGGPRDHPTEGPSSWGPGRRLFLGVGVRVPSSCWNGLLISSFPPLGVGRATGRGASPQGWDI